jgi:four helix bundle protein
LASQMRRAAVSAAPDIAEGFGKRGKPDTARFMNIAEGSIEESRYYLILTSDLDYANAEELMKLLEEVSRLLNSCCKVIRNSDR